LLVAVLAVTGLAQAGPLIFGTGLGAPGLPDEHYTMMIFAGVYPEDIPDDLSDVGTLPAYRLAPGGVPSNNPWMRYTTGVRWLAPKAYYGSYGSDPWGTYVLRTTFDLTGYDPATANIWGAWSSDNCGYDIRINGYSTGSWGMAAPNCLSTKHDFSIGASLSMAQTIGETTTYSQVMPFLAGINTIEFVFENFNCAGCTYNPTGAIVDLYASADEMAVPEPGVWLLLPSAAVVLFVRMRHSRRAPR
jgi:hypothetical protein